MLRVGEYLVTGVQAAILGQGDGIVPAPAFAGTTVTLASDGTATGTGSPAWFTPTRSGVGSSYWARITRTGGTSGAVVFSPASGVWYSLSAGQTWSAVGGAGGCNGTIEIASDSGGANIVATGTISVNNAI